MLKITTALAALLLSSTVLAGSEPTPPAPYPDGAPPQKADSSNPGASTNRLGNNPSDPKSSKDAQTSSDEKEKAKIDSDSSDDVE